MMDAGGEEAIGTACLALLEAAGADRGLLERLAQIHDTLWSLEDRARSRQASAAEIADLKRAIDGLNGERHATIGRLDAPLLARGRADTGTHFSETPGELADRLVILALKSRHAQANRDATDLPEALRRTCGERAAGFDRWRSYLQACLERELRALAAGEAVLPPRDEFKMYNDPLLNPVTRREGAGVRTG